MKKVLMLLKSKIYAGAEKVTIEIMERLQKEYEFYYASPNGKIAGKLRGMRYLPMRNFRITEIRRVIRLVQPDIIHAHDFSASVLASLLKGVGKDRMLISHIHCNAKENLVWGKKAFFYWIALKRIDRVICVSDVVAKEAVFRDAWRKKAVILENFVDRAGILEMAERGKGTVGFGTQKKIEEVYLYDLIFVGRLSKQKNPKKFIRILDGMIREGKDIRAALIGEGEEYEACCQLIQRYHLEGKAEMLGFLENPYFVMKRSRILCMTSEEEGFGLAVAEAMVLGVPVLVAEVGGMKELLGSGAEEFCRTEQEYVKKAIRLLEDDSFYRKEQRRMKERAAGLLAAEEYMEQIRAIYKGGMV